MGRLIDGEWKKTSIITSDESGSYDRIPRSFLDGISKDDEKFQPESDRYHLYVSYACPWAHRALIFRELKGLTDHIGVSVVHPHMLECGWSFDSDWKGATGDQLYSKNFLYEIYQKADSNVSTSVTVPVLWDKKHETIVNNESSEIIRIFNSSFNELTGNKEDFYPEEHRDEINDINSWVYEYINNGVYKAGFAKNQKAYDEAVHELFKHLDKVEEILKEKDFLYLVGETLTEADIRLLTTLIRFDLVYNIHFKCSLRKISEYKFLNDYLENLLKLEAVKKTTNYDHIKQHYYYSHEEINPNRIVPLLIK